MTQVFTVNVIVCDVMACDMAYDITHVSPGYIVVQVTMVCVAGGAGRFLLTIPVCFALTHFVRRLEILLQSFGTSLS